MHWGSKLSYIWGDPNYIQMERKVPSSYLGRRLRGRVLPSFSLYVVRMPSNSHPHPSHDHNPSPHTFDCLRRRSSRLRERAVLMAVAAAMPPPALPPSSSSLLLLWLVIARHGQLDALHAAALRHGRFGFTLAAHTTS